MSGLRISANVQAVTGKVVYVGESEFKLILWGQEVSLAEEDSIPVGSGFVALVTDRGRRVGERQIS